MTVQAATASADDAIPHLEAGHLLVVPVTPETKLAVRFPRDTHRHYELSQLSSSDALRLLSDDLEALVRRTGDLPSPPPLPAPPVAHMRAIQAEKASSTSGARPASSHAGLTAYRTTLDAMPAAGLAAEPVDGVRLRAAAGGYGAVVVAAAVAAGHHGAVARKFFLRSAPAVGVAEYLARLHRYCPMSGAVYLAASVYLRRVAVDERAVAVTPRTVHRLVLAALRVASKVLEDRVQAHDRVAKVGGVERAELTRLELMFCFLTGFDLAVGEEALRERWEVLEREALEREGEGGGEGDGEGDGEGGGSGA